MKVTGLKLDWRGDKVKATVKSAIESGLQNSAEDVLIASNKIVPLDTGELRNSGEVVRTNNSSKESVSIAYDAEHAVPVHETPKNYRNGRKHKFLETALNGYTEQFVKEMQSTISRELR